MAFASTAPYNDPGQLFGGIRQRVTDLRSIQADTFRSASQSQGVTQSGRSFSGAVTTNDLTQRETLTQNAESTNTKTIIIDDANPSSVPTGFNFNFLEKALTQVSARDFLSRSILNFAQEQIVNQDGFAAGRDFAGNPSIVTNTLTQDETVNQNATSRVQTTIRSLRDPDVENNARFREALVDVSDSLTEVGTVASQNQGSADNMSVQSGRADGGIVNNFLNQNAVGTVNNNSFQQNTIDISVDGANNTLTPRSQTTLVRIENDHVRNFGSASQTQGLFQIAEGGVDEFGNPTENGGNVNNVSNQTASFTENSAAMNTLSVLA